MTDSANLKEKRVGRLEVPMTERAGYSPRECAGLFGRAETWGYRRIYDGTFKPVNIGGRMLIPRAQVEALMQGRAAK